MDQNQPRKVNPRSVTTKKGDSGYTDMLYGDRVSKADDIIEACGILDEVVAQTGLARAASNDDWIKERLLQIQNKLFSVGAELATTAEMRARLNQKFVTIEPTDVEQLETEIIDYIEQRIDLGNSFIIPGNSQASAMIDMAKTVVRRLERYIVKLETNGKVHNPNIIKYLNRLSDAMFLLARYQDRELGQEKLTKTIRKSR